MLVGDYWEKAYPEIKMPYSRESDYFATREQAHNCLQIMKLEMSLEGSWFNYLYADSRFTVWMLPLNIINRKFADTAFY